MYHPFPLPPPPGNGCDSDHTVLNANMNDFPCPFAIKIQNKCCGDTGGDSWNGTSWQQRDGQTNSVPDSCCKTPSEGCGIRTHPSNINNKVELIGNYVTGQIIMSSVLVS